MKMKFSRQSPLSRNVLLGLGLGICPALAVSTSLKNGIGLGLAVALVLIVSSGLIGILKKVIPVQIQIPASCVVIGAVVTLADMFCKVVTPVLSSNLGIYIPLIAVNCIVLGHAQTVAFKLPLKQTLLDALVCGLGFFGELFILSALREILGTGTLLELPVIPGKPLLPIATLPIGGLLVFAALLAVVRSLALRKAEK